LRRALRRARTKHTPWQSPASFLICLIGASPALPTGKAEAESGSREGRGVRDSVSARSAQGPGTAGRETRPAGYVACGPTWRRPGSASFIPGRGATPSRKPLESPLAHGDLRRASLPSSAPPSARDTRRRMCCRTKPFRAAPECWVLEAGSAGRLSRLPYWYRRGCPRVPVDSGQFLLIQTKIAASSRHRGRPRRARRGPGFRAGALGWSRLGVGTVARARACRRWPRLPQQCHSSRHQPDSPARAARQEGSKGSSTQM